MELLKNRKVTAEYLANKFEVSVRSVYRYIDVLSANNVAVFCTRGRNGGIQIADNYRLPAALLTGAEQEEIFAALNLLKGARPTADIDTIRDKFLAVNTADVSQNLVMTGDKLMLEGVIGDSRLYRAKIEPLSTAIDDCNVVKIVYHDRGGEITERNIQPHAFVLKDMIWYVYAYCELRQGFRMFKISRIEKLIITDGRFERKPRAEFTPWNLDFHEDAQTVDLLLYVAADARYDVEEWLGVECVKPQKNKAYPFVASATVSAGDGLIPKLMSFGAGIKIVSPASVKTSLTEVVKKLLDGYFS